MFSVVTVGTFLIWVGVIVGLYRVSKGHRLDNSFPSIFGGLILTVVLMMLTVLGSDLYNSYWGTSKSVLQGHTNLYSIQRETSINGSFFLGSGSLQGTTYYIGYLKDSEGFYHLAKFDTNVTSIKETNEFFPRYEHYKNYECSKFSKVMLGFNCMNTATNTPNTYKLYVPEGTIIQQYSLE